MQGGVSRSVHIDPRRREVVARNLLRPRGGPDGPRGGGAGMRRHARNGQNGGGGVLGGRGCVRRDDAHGYRCARARPRRPRQGDPQRVDHERVRGVRPPALQLRPDCVHLLLHRDVAPRLIYRQGALQQARGAPHALPPRHQGERAERGEHGARAPRLRAPPLHDRQPVVGANPGGAGEARGRPRLPLPGHPRGGAGASGAGDAVHRVRPDQASQGLRLRGPSALDDHPGRHALPRD
mmetsp:Transcript_51003/g.121459  ORF Transcript_51003/g.121459 Transcript_51003/m.121459 type:complete len:237 (-) Transcript_51003:1181-1891(-)